MRLIHDIRSRIEAVIPNSDDFGDHDGSYAQNAGICVAPCATVRHRYRGRAHREHCDAVYGHHRLQVGRVKHSERPRVRPSSADGRGTPILSWWMTALAEAALESLEVALHRWVSSYDHGKEEQTIECVNGASACCAQEAFDHNEARSEERCGHTANDGCNRTREHLSMRRSGPVSSRTWLNGTSSRCARKRS